MSSISLVGSAALVSVWSKFAGIKSIPGVEYDRYKVRERPGSQVLNSMNQDKEI